MTRPNKLGKYELLELIGRGGMGSVYKAVDPELGRLVGIKVMSGSQLNSPDALKRFYREARAAGSLRHPNVITIHDLGAEQGTPYIVMEFLEGQSLATVIADKCPLTLSEKLNIAIQICDGLGYAHERNVVHRDIKPPNLMLLKDGTVKIVDFGIAITGDERFTGTGQVLGTSHYISPEQLQGQDVDGRSDLFSTGVSLYELITYAHPFHGSTLAETLLKITQDDPPPLNCFLHAPPPQLESILRRTLAKNRTERYRTAGDLASDLAGILEQLDAEHVSEDLQTADALMSAEQWEKAETLLTSVLKVDRQNARAISLLRNSRQQIKQRELADRVKSLWVEADRALTSNAFDEATCYLDIALALGKGDSRLLQLRDSLKRKNEVARKLPHPYSAKSTRPARDSHQNAPMGGRSMNTGHPHFLLNEIIGKAHWLVRVQRYGEAVKFLEGYEHECSSLPEYWQAIEEVHLEHRRVRVLSVVKEQVRNALRDSDFQLSRAVLDRYRKEYGDGRDTKLLEREIEARREAVDQDAVTQALRDSQVLLRFQCYESALDVLDKVADRVSLLTTEVRHEYDLLRSMATAEMKQFRIKEAPSEDRARPALESHVLAQGDRGTRADSTLSEQTQGASRAQLRAILGEVTGILERYPSDSAIQAAAGDLRTKITLQLTVPKRVQG